MQKSEIHELSGRISARVSEMVTTQVGMKGSPSRALKTEVCLYKLGDDNYTEHDCGSKVQGYHLNMSKG
jgi:hypothetical protein